MGRREGVRGKGQGGRGKAGFVIFDNYVGKGKEGIYGE